MIGYAGLSHLGIVSSLAAAAKGFEVVAYDPKAALGAELSAGRLPFFEPGLSELLQANGTRIHFAADPEALRPCDVVVFSLDVPTDDAGNSDLTPLRGLIEQVSRITSRETSL